MSVHGKNWVVLCSDDECSERMTRVEAERLALQFDSLPDCGAP